MSRRALRRSRRHPSGLRNASIVRFRTSPKYSPSLGFASSWTRLDPVPTVVFAHFDPSTTQTTRSRSKLLHARCGLAMAPGQHHRDGPGVHPNIIRSAFGWTITLHQHRPISKGATPARDRPFVEARLPSDARCASPGCVRAFTLRATRPTSSGFRARTRWRACSASRALRDTSRRDAFPVGKPANPPREHWAHWRSFDRHVPSAAVVSTDLEVLRYRGPA